MAGNQSAYEHKENRMKNSLNLIWIDLEMTGLDPEKDRIIEIATVVTNKELTILAEGPVFAVNQSDLLLDNMDEWNTAQHSQSGLVKRVKESQVTEFMAEEQTIHFLEKYVGKGISPMCGNSICQDRRFLYRYMPNLAEFFHYRNLDVSTIKELARRWAPHLYQGFNKKSNHLALDDIKDSIAELRYYQQSFFRINHE